MNEAEIWDRAGLCAPALRWKRLVAESISRPLMRKRVLILGAGRLAKELCRSTLSKRAQMCEVVGFLDRDSSRIGERLVNPGIVGTYEQLFEIVERRRVDTIAVCLEPRSRDLPIHTLLDLKAMGIRVLDGHDLYEHESGRLPIDFLRPSWLVFSTGFRRYKILMGVKRFIDLAASVLGLIVLAPLFGVIALVIVLDSRGRVFYRQVRVGIHGRPFVMWKFRSMRDDAEVNGARWAVNGDPRMTRVGRWLRRWRIDELPQLVNVAKGEMSLVGPRPERPDFVEVLRGVIPYYDIRHTVRPGITGWAQVMFRYAASTEETHEKLEYDLYYLKNLSLGLDFRVLLASVPVVLNGAGAR